MRKLILALGAAFAATPAVAQDYERGPTHTYIAAGEGFPALHVHTYTGRHGPAIFAISLGDEELSSVGYSDEIRLTDETLYGNTREQMAPGAKQPVALFQVLPIGKAGHSKALDAACGGHKGVSFIGLEGPGGSVARNGFASADRLRLYIYDETFEPGRIVFRLCKVVELTQQPQ